MGACASGPVAPWRLACGRMVPRIVVISVFAHGSPTRRGHEIPSPVLAASGPARRSTGSADSRDAVRVSGAAAAVPVARCRCNHFTALATLTPNKAAVSRHDRQKQSMPPPVPADRTHRSDIDRWHRRPLLRSNKTGVPPSSRGTLGLERNRVDEYPNLLVRHFSGFPRQGSEFGPLLSDAHLHTADDRLKMWEELREQRAAPVPHRNLRKKLGADAKFHDFGARLIRLARIQRRWLLIPIYCNRVSSFGCEFQQSRRSRVRIDVEPSCK
jgi:hypothetical protein